MLNLITRHCGQQAESGQKRHSSCECGCSSTSDQEDLEHSDVGYLSVDRHDESMEKFQQEGQQEYTLAEYRARKQSRRSCRVFLLLLSLLIGGVVTVLIIFLKPNDHNDNAEPRGTASSIPSSYFEDPAGVEWRQQGRVIVDDLSTNELPVPNAYGIFAFKIDLSSDGTRLVVGTWDRGYAMVYHYNKTAEDWEVHTSLVASSQGAALDLQDGRHDFGRGVALSGDGQSLVIGGIDLVSLYGYNDSRDEWYPLDVQIGEYEKDDGTGLGVDLNFDGSVLAIGSPFFEGGNSQIGMIRIFKKSGRYGWQLASIVQGNDTAAIVGTGVRLSGDASTILDGNSYENSADGPQSGVMRSWKYTNDVNDGNNTESENWSALGQVLNGPSPNAFFGSYNDINDNGTVIATASQNEAAFVYELVSGQWQMKGGVLQTPGATLASGICLSADGNFVVVSTYQKAYAFQYDPENNNTDNSWVPVGTFPTEAQFGSRVSCSSDGRIIAVGRSSSAGRVGTVSVFQAFE